jgi:molecular chaperone GrpE
MGDERSELVDLSALAVPVFAWGDGEGWSPAERLGAIELDVRTLISELAAAQASAAEQTRSAEEEMRRLLLGLLGVLDAFDRVFTHIDEAQGGDGAADRPSDRLLANFGTVARMLQGLLAERGVTAIEPSDVFDPDVQTAVDTEPFAAGEEGRIVEQLRSGYRWNERILRKAEVVVAGAGRSSGEEA